MLIGILGIVRGSVGLAGEISFQRTWFKPVGKIQIQQIEHIHCVLEVSCSPILTNRDIPNLKACSGQFVSASERPFRPFSIPPHFGALQRGA